MEQKYFPSFYRKHVKQIYRFLYYRVGGDKETAQDLTQDVFLKAYEAFERYDERVSQNAWIFTIARNHLLNSIAKTRPQTSLDDIEETAWAREDWAAKAEIRYDEKRLLEGMKKLDAEDQYVLRRKHLEGWSFDDIAAETGKNTGALRVQSHRAMKKLKVILKKR